MAPRLFGGSQFSIWWPCLAESRVVEGTMVVSGRRGVAGGHDCGRGAVKRCLFRRVAAWRVLVWWSRPHWRSSLSAASSALPVRIAVWRQCWPVTAEQRQRPRFRHAQRCRAAMRLVPPRNGWLFSQQQPRGGRALAARSDGGSAGTRVSCMARLYLEICLRVVVVVVCLCVCLALVHVCAGPSPRPRLLSVSLTTWPTDDSRLCL